MPPPPAEAMHGIVRAALGRWGWVATPGTDDDAAGAVIERGVIAALNARPAALWSASDVATVMNLAGLDVAARLAATATDGIVSREAMREALNAPAAWAGEVGTAAVESVQASGSQMDLMKLRSWRGHKRDHSVMSFGASAKAPAAPTTEANVSS